jgi:hypothetical protein
MIFTRHQILFRWSNQGGGDRVCGMFGVEEKCIHGFGGGSLKERDNLEDLVGG